jgi:hypothetical protein
MLQALGNFDAAQAFVDKWGAVPPEVDRVVAKFAGIPTDVAPKYDASRFSTASL